MTARQLDRRRRVLDAVHALLAGRPAPRGAGEGHRRARRGVAGGDLPLLLVEGPPARRGARRLGGRGCAGGRSPAVAARRTRQHGSPTLVRAGRARLPAASRGTRRCSCSWPRRRDPHAIECMGRLSEDIGGAMADVAGVPRPGNRRRRAAHRRQRVDGRVVRVRARPVDVRRARALDGRGVPPAPRRPASNLTPVSVRICPHGRAAEDHQRRRPRRRAAARVADLAAREVPRARARASSASGGATFKHTPGAKYEMDEDPDGQWGDAWYLRRTSSSTCTSGSSRSRSTPTPGRRRRRSSTATQMEMTAVTYDEMRPGCYDRDARIKDFELNWVDGSLPFPTFPRFCGQTFYEGDDKELGLACVQAYNDWMVEEWCAPSRRHEHPALPHPAVGRRAGRRRRSSATPTAACAPSASASCPHHLKLPSIHTGYWDPLFAGVQRHRRHAVHAHRLVVDEPGRRRPTRPAAWAARWRSTTRWRRWPTGCSPASSSSSRS